jgi:pimeloyl-ACP methyl ester carboxylesterase
VRKSIEIGGRSLGYLEAGRGEPLVLLHAFPLSADMWRPQLAAVPAGWRLIAPDLRGFGPSAHPAPPAASIDDYASDVVDLLDALKIREAVIGGLSMGGYVTFALLRLAPSYFRGLVLADTKTQADSDAARLDRARMQRLVDERGPAAIADEMLPKLLSETARSNHPQVAADVRRTIEATDPGAIKAALAALMARPDSASLLGGVHRPTLILVGEQDTITPESDAEAMRARMPGATLVRIPSAGHLSNLERPVDFNNALHRFLLEKV